MADEQEVALFSPYAAFPSSHKQQQQPWEQVEEEDAQEEDDGEHGPGDGKQDEAEKKTRHQAVLIEQLLDERWFWDNVVRWRKPSRPAAAAPAAAPASASPLSSPSGSRRPAAGVRRCSSSSSIELMEPLRPRQSSPRRSLLLGEAKRRFGDIRIQVPERRQDLDELTFLGDVEEEAEYNDKQKPPAQQQPQQQQQQQHGSRTTAATHHPPSEELPESPTTTKSPGKLGRRRLNRRGRGSKSLTELEIDELRGCLDLGFRPSSKDALSPRVVRVGSPTASGRQQHYASQGWLISRPDSPLLNWRVPGPNQPGVDMKKHLKFWANAVASTVRQEC